MEQSQTIILVHDMYRLLNECGEDTSCGCGCSGDDDEEEPKDKKLKGKKQKLESVGLTTSSAIEEARRRRKIGLKTIRRLKKVHVIRGNKAPKVIKVAKMKDATRKGAANNRHR